ncbi:Lrp/AsnC family transcriptional regulator [Glycomyces buryatensis]|uniref:Lrp/AsnC family transcriptional regulator n=1 Tax=Glycomyces buryatensis TaxID=2570927 RepID=A0A4V4HT12_9ACTN|nr:Lrp/AsnC family transcriptional regulator [Glycomyces buryatensis]THV43216.1 Lrp/AsnC family transcriptional regulator [Glycomyces buryatensis]
MDEIDRTILNLLRADGRTSYAELARRVGLTAPSVQDRVVKLEKNGVITGYRAVIDPETIGLGITALIGIIPDNSADHNEICERLRAIPQMESCYFLAGVECYQLKVRVPKMGDLERLIHRLGAIPGVAQTRTTITLSTKWEDRPQPVPGEEDPHGVD